MPSETQQFYYKNNRLQQLRGFCMAAQYGNISKAARQLGLSQATVSLQIKTLEDALGVELFHRNGPRLGLSEEGERLLHMSLPHVDGIDAIYDNFHQRSAEVKRTELHLSVNSTTLNFILPRLLRPYFKAHPDIFITAHYAEHEEALEKLQSGKIEAALLPERAHKPFPSAVRYIPTHYFRPALITRPDHALAGRKSLTVEEISQHELTLPAEDLRVIPNLYDIFPAHRINKRLRINFVNWETTRRYIEEGLVISISSDVIITENDTLMATYLDHLFPQVSYGLVVMKTKHLPDKLQKLIDIARLDARGRAA